jgi:hypothetical protein
MVLIEARLRVRGSRAPWLRAFGLPPPVGRSVDELAGGQWVIRACAPGWKTS